ncbi:MULTISPECIES: hypothetical protein [unclassified Streptomyces]|uniref:hypothetical protein n=1 Tax=unclassified Streptomyces TaxID=2593676 RepID=UPI00381F025E
MAEVPDLTHRIRTLGDLVSGNDKLLRAARDTLPNPENSTKAIAALPGASVGTPYNHYRGDRAGFDCGPRYASTSWGHRGSSPRRPCR